MQKKKSFDPEEHQEGLLSTSIKDLEYGIEIGTIPLNPTRIFQVGQRVQWGAHEEVYIREVYHDNLYYKVETIRPKKIIGRGQDILPSKNYQIQPWMELFPWTEIKNGCVFSKEEKYFIRQSNSTVDSLLHSVYSEHAGVDFDIEYQREHVWTIKEKVELIESIFNNVDIGKFVFTVRPFISGVKHREVIDGKQRLTALCEFYEDRFKYKGYYFSELSWKDKHKFQEHGVTIGDLEQPDQRGIYETFIKLNTCGKPMDHKHIDKVKKLLKDL